MDAGAQSPHGRQAVRVEGCRELLSDFNIGGTGPRREVYACSVRTSPAGEMGRLRPGRRPKTLGGRPPSFGASVGLRRPSGNKRLWVGPYFGYMPALQLLV
jgi:hypothetical protein